MSSIVHKNVAVLRVSDPKVFAEIRAVVPLDDYVLGRLSDTELVIDPARMKELLSRLDAKGLQPLVKRESQEPVLPRSAGLPET